MNKKTVNKLIAGTVKDAILERLANYTPIESGHEALIMRYTVRMYDALELFVATNKIRFDLTSLKQQIDAQVELAENDGDGWHIPVL